MEAQPSASVPSNSPPVMPTLQHLDIDKFNAMLNAAILSQTLVPPENDLKVLESDINMVVKEFNHPLTMDDCLLPLREKLSKLYNIRGRVNIRRDEYAEAIHDFTKSLEYWKNDLAFVNRGVVFVKFLLMKQSWDDMVQALKCNPKNQHAIRIKGQLEYLYGHILKYQGAKF